MKKKILIEKKHINFAQKRAPFAVYSSFNTNRKYFTDIYDIAV